MANKSRSSGIRNGLSITAVENEVGIGKDRLRVWERRYGFPAPLRDAHGERRYPPTQVEKLKAIKRLIDCGYQPRRLIPLDDDALAALLGPKPSGWHTDPEAHNAVEMLRQGRLEEFDRWMRNAFLRQGLERFALRTGRAVLEAVAEAWRAGALSIWQEHYFSERFSALFAAAASASADDGQALTVLLATPAGERHGLALAMVHALFASRGVTCISLGTDMPNAEIVAAAVASDADIVALSISVGYPTAKVRDVLSGLRRSLPAATQLWVGGAATEALGHRRRPESVKLLPGLEDGLAALEDAMSG